MAVVQLNYLGKILTPIASNQFDVACKEHDVCYETYGKSQQECDKAFHNRMLGICGRDHNTWFGRGLKIACNGRADAYYTGVLEYGGTPYKNAQSEASRQIEAASRNTITFKNSCPRRLQLAIHFLNLRDQWETKAWYSFAPNESAQLNGVETKNRIIYYYAETTDGSRMQWSGNGTSQTIGGRTYKMIKKDMGSGFGNFTQNLTC